MEGGDIRQSDNIIRTGSRLVVIAAAENEEARGDLYLLRIKPLDRLESREFSLAR